jgi:hypothetical protein
MDDVFLIHSPDDIVLYRQSSATHDILVNDECVARVVELSRLAYADFELDHVQEVEEVRQLIRTAKSMST